LVERAPVGIFEIDAGLECVYVNPRWSEITGITAAEATGFGWTAAVHPDDVHTIGVELERAVAEGRDLQLETRFVRADGTVGWSLTNARITMVDGRISGFTGTFADITQQHEVEEQLAYNEARLSALFEASSDIMAILEPDGNWHASPAGTRILGYPIGYEEDGGLLGLVHPDDLERAITAVAEVTAGTRAKHEPVRLRVRHIDGHYRWFECVGEDRTDDPVVGGVVIIARDVTEQQRAEEAQAEAEKRFRTAFELSPLGIALVDLDGRFLDVNPAYCRTVGRSEDDLIGADSLGLVFAEDRDRAVSEGIQRAAGRPDRIPEPVRLLHADGRTVWVLTDTSLVEDGAGEAAYVIAIVTDVTERKKLERKLEFQAYHDPLTHLANRARLRDLLETAWDRHGHDGRLALLFVDLDRFKSVNDTLGHDAGDEVLLLAARRLERAVRAGDSVARFGGDEFVVICEQVAGADEAAQIANRIRESLAVTYRLSAGIAEVAASVGVAVDDGEATVDDLLRKADRAAYRAKELGRNRVVVEGRGAMQQAV
jgi:diguanylate cyclase (GGDEF)-like protein/PAS domain S-box-containing protein